MIIVWHSGYGDRPLGIYLSKNIYILKSYLLDFQVCNKVGSIWWTCLHNNNLMKHCTWKCRKCNVMKKKKHVINKIHLSQSKTKKLTKVYAYEYQSANYYLQHTKNSRFWHFLVVFFFQFLNSKLQSLITFMPPSVCCSIPSIVLV